MLPYRWRKSSTWCQLLASRDGSVKFALFLRGRLDFIGLALHREAVDSDFCLWRVGLGVGTVEVGRGRNARLALLHSAAVRARGRSPSWLLPKFTEYATAWTHELR
jgi:hypothetical protein